MTSPADTTRETYHDIYIDDSELNESGFSKFALPLNGNGSALMTLYNEDRSKIIYCRFYKSDLDRTVKSLEEKLSSDEFVGDNIVRSLVTYFKNQCIILRQDKDSGFFNGNGSHGNVNPKHKQQQRQSPDEEADNKCMIRRNQRETLHPSIPIKVRVIYMRP